MALFDIVKAGNLKVSAEPPPIQHGARWLNTKTNEVVRWCEREGKWMKESDLYLSMSGAWLPKTELDKLPAWAKAGWNGPV